MALFSGWRSRLGWFLFLPSSVALGGQGFWTSNGPPASIAAIAIPESGTIIAAGRPFGASQDAVFTRSVSEAEWKERAEASPGVTITALGVDPSHTATIYAAGEVDDGMRSGAIYVSRDNGITWSFLHLFEKSPVFAIAVDPVLSTTLYVGGSLCSNSSVNPCMGVVSRSLDGGATWGSSPLFSSATSVTSLVIHPSQPRGLFAGTDVGLLHSNDSGTTWSAPFGPVGANSEKIEIECIALNPVNPLVIYVGWHTPPCGFFITDCNGPFGEGGAAASNDGGGHWRFLNAPAQIESIAIDPANPQILFASAEISPGGIYRSRDGGTTWSPIGDLSGALNIRFDPQTGVVYAATLSGVFEYEEVPPNRAGPGSGRRARAMPSRR